MTYKQVILVRKDLKLPEGKLGSQTAHASVEAVLKSHKDDVTAWKKEGMKKIILGVKDQEELFKFKLEAEDAGLVCGLIADQGKTVVVPGTFTALGIGPDKEEKIDAVTGKLKPL